MSAYSTIRMTREKAISHIEMKLKEPHLPNSVLELIMDMLLESQLYNCIITDACFLDEDE